MKERLDGALPGKTQGKSKEEEEAEEAAVHEEWKAQKAADSKAQKEIRKETRKTKPSVFPLTFNNKDAEDLIKATDFSKPDYVETNEGTRRAFVHYVRKNSKNEIEFDCWIGANGHPPKSKDGWWRPGHSYILEWPLEITTTDKALAAISALQNYQGQRPDIL